MDDVTPHELRTIEFRQAWRGYDQGDVDELLDRVALTLEQLYEQIKVLSDRVEAAEAASGGEVEQMLRRTLMLAQQTADAAVAEAQQTAARTLDDANQTAARVIDEAKAEAESLRNSERGRIEMEVNDLIEMRDLLTEYVDELDRFERDYRDRLRRVVEEDLVALANRPSVPAPPRPGDPTATRPVPEADVQADVEADIEPDIEPDIEIDLPRSEAPARSGRSRPLSDDEFFASLREAVHDTAPLGPREIARDDAQEAMAGEGAGGRTASVPGGDEGEASGRFGTRFRRRG